MPRSPSLSHLQLEHIDAMAAKFRHLSAKFPTSHLLGEGTMLSTMVDWNPAEIIGREPRHLARTLYENAVTDQIWAEQRRNYGYRDVTGHPLLTALNGIPYIDVRVDFNSWIPADLNPVVAEKLVNYYLQKLQNAPENHDKVEFEILYTNFYPGLHERLIADLRCNNTTQVTFSDADIAEIEQSLSALTHKMLVPVADQAQIPSTKSITEENQQIQKLEERRKAILESNLSKIQKVSWLMDDLRKYGTLPFAGLARCGFVAIQFLRSLRSLDVISQIEMEDFMASLSTVTKQLAAHVRSLREGKMSKATFLSIYGHLRPGTYDILSSRYDEEFDLYFSGVPELQESDPPCQTEATNSILAPTLAFVPTTMKNIQQALVRSNINVDATILVKFMKEAIEGREHSKFIFTRCLSDILSLIASIGLDFGISRDDISFIDLKSILNLYKLEDLANTKANLESIIQKNKQQYFTITQSVLLPSLIWNEHQFYEFEEIKTLPNFVTNNRVIGKVVLISSVASTVDFASLRGNIALIRSADPGYDWLFTHNIGGLITCYGGSNSHMSIRCHELGLVAVIGAGANNFDLWKSAHTIDIDCQNKKVNIIE